VVPGGSLKVGTAFEVLNRDECISGRSDIFSPAICRRFAPIDGCLYMKQLDLFLPFANISLNAAENGYFLLQHVRFCQKIKIDGLSRRKAI
jgi:hypothetical protein